MAEKEKSKVAFFMAHFDRGGKRAGGRLGDMQRGGWRQDTEITACCQPAHLVCFYEPFLLPKRNEIRPNLSVQPHVETLQAGSGNYIVGGIAGRGTWGGED